MRYAGLSKALYSKVLEILEHLPYHLYEENNSY